MRGYSKVKLSKSNKFGRFLWQLTYFFLFRPSPWFMFAWRNWLLGWWGAEIDQAARIYPSAFIWAPWNLKIGQCATVGRRVYILNVASVQIGSNTVISDEAEIITASKKYNERERSLVVSSVVIGERCWIARKAAILPGTVLADKSVVLGYAIVQGIFRESRVFRAPLAITELRRND